MSPREGETGMLQSWSCLPSNPDCFRCEFVSFGEGLSTPPDPPQRTLDLVHYQELACGKLS